MKKIFIKLLIVQEKRILRDDGFTYRKCYRINPYNPLSYVLIPVSVIVGLLMYGFVGITNEFDFQNPFKYR